MVEASTRGELRALLAVEPVYDDSQWPAPALPQRRLWRHRAEQRSERL